MWELTRVGDCWVSSMSPSLVVLEHLTMCFSRALPDSPTLKVLSVDVVSPSLVVLEHLTLCFSRAPPNSPTSGIRAVRIKCATNYS
ncbi:hypothetical protein L195_g032640 [Trifolium pratense]|uniref:Uncharacterized protein n=1 Tax=Trifolium pratense TaxID=57577 RepID=A0A2K3LDT5_TRIPR|nr:hypothetical protein L195_g032640 [Trifolium pratense]